MGYYQKTEHVEFHIPAGNLPFVLDLLKGLNHPIHDAEKNGGSYSGGKTLAKWYSWMPADYDKTVTSVKEVFELLGFEDCVEDETGFTLGEYDCKRGQEQLFLNAVAPFVTSGSRIQFSGEDGSNWYLEFDGSEMAYHQLQETPWSGEDD